MELPAAVCAYQVRSRGDRGKEEMAGCGRPATVIREGTLYCNLHDPEDAKRLVPALVERQRRMAACWDLCNGVADERLALITAAGGLAAILQMIEVLGNAREWIDRVQAAGALVDIAGGNTPSDRPRQP